ncbi:tRNA-specific 2-thiouridylase MnmA [compost metagenome]
MARHEGIHNYTYGQSKGLGMDHHEKLFVIKIDAQDNTVWVGDEQYLFANEVDVVDPKLLDAIEDGEIMNVKIRYQHKGSEAQVFKTATGFKLKFQEPQRAVTPGQAAVFYRDKQLVGGGWITL